MRLAILTQGEDLAGYLAELCRAWGLAGAEVISAPTTALDPVDTPVVIVPAGALPATVAEALVAYAQRGGTVIALLPEGLLATAAGITVSSEKAAPLHLRLSGLTTAGVAGELLPVVGRAAAWQLAPAAQPVAWLSVPRQYAGESPGIVVTPVGGGRIIALAFDLARCVLLLRQGDPSHAEVVPPGDGCARPSHLAVTCDADEAAWLPFADLLARLLVDLVRQAWPGPLPLVAQLPGQAPGLLLYSGDEDHAQVAWNDEELDCVAAAGARMNLYLIPIATNSTAADAARYARAHDLGPHPNLRSLDGQPVSMRLRELARQIRLFTETFGLPARSVRNHCTAWAGYLEPIEVLAELGVRLDANYFCTSYQRSRCPAPYTSFGAALPVRFCRLSGQLLDVYGQHTHLSDDIAFHPTVDYSFKYTPAPFSGVLHRIFGDLTTRFHTPFAVCIHPSNWVKFSRAPGQELLRQAAAFGMPVWSNDQWLDFWTARATWRCQDMTWNGTELGFRAVGARQHDDLRLFLPLRYGQQELVSVTVAGTPVTWCAARRHGEPTAILPLAGGGTDVAVCARYARAVPGAGR